MQIGILAYGSLIEDPGSDIEPLIEKRIIDVETPFKIEFARKSRTRYYAPTLVLSDKGSTVIGQILVLKNSITLKEAKTLLWRRETGNTTGNYQESDNPSPNKVTVGILKNFKNIDYVLYTKINANIENPTAEILANLAIESAKKDAGKKRKDGISYLISVKNQGIVTPLMDEYEKKILEVLGVETLEDAREHILRN